MVSELYSVLGIVSQALEIVVIYAVLLAFVLFTAAVMFYPLIAALRVLRASRKEDTAPRVRTGFRLWVLAAGSGMVLAFYPGWIPIPVSIPAVAGILVCGVTGGSILLCRWRSWPFRKSLGICGVLGVCVLVWADLRFRIVIHDAEGRLVGVADEEHGKPGRTPRGDYRLQHEVEDAWVTVWDHAETTEVLDGVIYIGLFQWLEWRDSWKFSGMPGLDFRRCTWDAWPAEVVWPPRF